MKFGLAERNEEAEEEIKTIETHAPKYSVETKVAAPVYILPRHGPVIPKMVERPHHQRKTFGKPATLFLLEQNSPLL